MMYSINSRTVSINSRTASNVSKLDSSLNPRSFLRIEDRVSSVELRETVNLHLSGTVVGSLLYVPYPFPIAKVRVKSFLPGRRSYLYGWPDDTFFYPCWEHSYQRSVFRGGHPFCSLLCKSLFLYLLRHHYIMLRCQGRVMCVLNCCWMMVLVPTCRLGTKKVNMILHVTCTCSWIFLIICILSFSSLVLFCLAMHFSL